MVRFKKIENYDIRPRFLKIILKNKLGFNLLIINELENK